MPSVAAIAPMVAAAGFARQRLANFRGMKHLHHRAVALALAIMLSLCSTSPHAVAALPRHPACKPVDKPGEAAPGGSADLACLSGTERVELLDRPVAPALIPPFARERRLQNALHRWKAREAQALATPQPERQDALAAYLEGREIEALRSDALKDTEAAIVRAETRILQLGVDFRATTQLATRWINRQPGRSVPGVYLERIVTAADAILAEAVALRIHHVERDAINRYFDEQLERVLTMQG